MIRLRDTLLAQDPVLRPGGAKDKREGMRLPAGKDGTAAIWTFP